MRGVIGLELTDTMVCAGVLHLPWKASPLEFRVRRKRGCDRGARLEGSVLCGAQEGKGGGAGGQGGLRKSSHPQGEGRTGGCRCSEELCGGAYCVP